MGGGGVGGAWVASFTPGANPGRDGPGYMNAYTVCEFEITILNKKYWGRTSRQLGRGEGNADLIILHVIDPWENLFFFYMGR